MEIKVLIEAPQLASAINNLAAALGNGAVKAPVAKDVTDLSDADIVALPNGEDPRKYTMFDVLTKAAQALKEADVELYEGILYKYVDQGKKYSAIEAKDWGKATNEFKAALKKAKTKDAEDEVEEEEAPKPTKHAGKKTKPKEEPEEVEEPEEDDYSDTETEEPRLSQSEIRKLAAKASSQGVMVGQIMKEVTGVLKVSLIPKEKYNAFEDALRVEMEE